MLPPKIGAHVEVFKRDERTGEQVLVSTTRPCAECGKPTDDGPVIPVENGGQVHLSCARGART